MPEAPAPVTLEMATFKSINTSPPIEVKAHFNPASLQYTIQNTLKEEGNGAKKKQYVGQTSAKLTMDLVFDTTDTGIDVRTFTTQMAKLLEPEGKSKAPCNVEFGWGVYRFTGLIEQYKETLDFFAAHGVPLRSSVNLTLASQDVTFDSAINDKASVDGELTPETVTVPARPGGGPPRSPASVANELGAPRAARAIAAANGAASLRFGAAGGLTVSAGASVSAGAGVGLGGGISASAGLSAGGARVGAAARGAASGGVTLAPAAAFSTGASAGAGGGAGLGLGIGAGAGIGVGAGAGIGASAAVAGGAFGGLRAGAAVAAIPSPRPLIPAASTVTVGAGVQFGPGGRALSSPSGASLGADVGANAELSARLTFGT